MKIGEVAQLGRHRLMCGDSGNPEHVAALFAGVKPDMVFCSPPYAQQRTYVSGIGDWDVLMQRVFGALPCHEKTQVLVNLGLVHRKGEWVPYWDGWIEWMREQGWRRFGWYVWNQGGALPRESAGRLGTSHENIFHFNKQRREPNKTIPCKHAGSFAGNKGMRSPHGGIRMRSNATTPVASHKVMDGVLSIGREKQNRTGHPAVFPVALPTEIIRAYTDPGDVVFDPFGGSGTTLLAAEREGRTALLMEIEPSYCDIAIERFRKACGQPPLPGAA